MELSDDEEINDPVSFKRKYEALQENRTEVLNRSIGTMDCRLEAYKSRIASWIVRHVKSGSQTASSLLNEEEGKDMEDSNKRARKKMPPGPDAPASIVCRTLDAMSSEVPCGSLISGHAPKLHAHKSLKNDLLIGIRLYDVCLQMASLETGGVDAVFHHPETLLDYLPCDVTTFIYEYTWKDVSAFTCTSRAAAHERYRRILCEEDGYGDMFKSRMQPCLDTLRRRFQLDVNTLKACLGMMNDMLKSDNALDMRKQAVRMAWREATWCPVCLRISQSSDMPEVSAYSCRLRRTRKFRLSPLPAVDNVFCPYHQNVERCYGKCFPPSLDLEEYEQERTKLAGLKAFRDHSLRGAILKATREAEERSRPCTSILRSGPLLCEEFFSLRDEIQRLIEVGRTKSRKAYLAQLEGLFDYVHRLQDILEQTESRKPRPAPHIVHRRCQGAIDDSVRPELRFPLAEAPARGQTAVEMYQDTWYFTVAGSCRPACTSTRRKMEAAKDYSLTAKATSVFTANSRKNTLASPSFQGAYSWNDVDTSRFPGQSYNGRLGPDVDRDVQCQIETLVSNHKPQGPKVTTIGASINKCVAKVSGVVMDPVTGNILGNAMRSKDCQKCTRSIYSCTCKRSKRRTVRPILLNGTKVPSCIQTAKAWRRNLKENVSHRYQDLILWFPDGAVDLEAPETPNLHGEDARLELETSIKERWLFQRWENDINRSEDVLFFIVKHDSDWNYYVVKKGKKIGEEYLLRYPSSEWNNNRVSTGNKRADWNITVNAAKKHSLSFPRFSAVLTKRKVDIDAQQRLDLAPAENPMDIVLRASDRLYCKQPDGTYTDIIHGGLKPDHIRVERVGNQSLEKMAEIRRLIGGKNPIRELFVQTGLTCAHPRRTTVKACFKGSVLSRVQPSASDCLLNFKCPQIVSRREGPYENIIDEKWKGQIDGASSRTEKGVHVPRLQMCNYQCPRCQIAYCHDVSNCSRCSATLRPSTCHMCCRSFGLFIVTTSTALETLVCSVCNSVLDFSIVKPPEEEVQRPDYVRLYFEDVQDHADIIYLATQIEAQTSIEVDPINCNGQAGIEIPLVHEKSIRKWLREADMKGHGPLEHFTVYNVGAVRRYKTIDHKVDIKEVAKNLGPMRAVDTSSRLATLMSVGHLASLSHENLEEEIHTGEIMIDSR